MQVLVVVDMQNDFIDGALGTLEAQGIVDSVKEKIEKYKNIPGAKIFYTRDTHEEEYMQTQEGRNLPVPHCIRGTHGWEISGALDTSDCEVIDKPTFGSVALAQKLAVMQPDQIELVGLCTDICVISNAMLCKAYMPETEILVDPACCAGVTPESHNRALKAMSVCQIKIL